MARQNRRDVFDPLEVSVVHCIQRVVRRAMLCGWDPVQGKSYEHRREWIRERLQFLASQYGIDVLNYSIMGNHLHVLLRNRPDLVRSWSDEEVARRIWTLFPKRKDAQGQAAGPRPQELKRLCRGKKRLAEYRRRLSDISWLMRQLAEKIARQANAEDQCTGRFWEGRFKCQPLLDESALLACAMYVDLNPIRAGMAETPETSDYTSVQDRVVSLGRADDESRLDSWLSPISLEANSAAGPQPSRSGLRASDKGYLPMTCRGYLRLLYWTGGQLAQGKRGRIPADCRSTLESLDICPESWCDLVGDFEGLFRRVVGKRQSLLASAARHGLQHRQSSGGVELLSRTH